MRATIDVQTADLDVMIWRCADAFRRVAAFLITDDPEAINYDALRNAWNRYYLEEFSSFDAMLQRHVKAGGNHYACYLPVSISHHNLHRLFEVLDLQRDGASLDTSRIPERIDDLNAVVQRLGELMADISCKQPRS